jgi:protoheme ferro-lyase
MAKDSPESKRVAVVLFNLGGPDSLKAVRPFLFNLFADRAIIDLPAIARYPLAAVISSGRNKSAQANYAVMGGASPLLPETQAQADALEISLQSQSPDTVVRCFIAMRYWRPSTADTAKASLMRSFCCRSTRNIRPRRPAHLWRNGPGPIRVRDAHAPSVAIRPWTE